MRALAAFLLSYYLLGVCCFVGMCSVYPGSTAYPTLPGLIMMPIILLIVLLFFRETFYIPIVYFASFAVFYYCYYRKKKVNVENVV